ncbi:hypothetical protein BDB00DRAFT_879404 [Zychaea mexicana]|uniref:uncharacterized protein n=1 Tax=Zychaea mexicana TaxID=64656 RepID=UPI0022FE60B3|nr:uncharacterized protein BDB00DRAFT_879404 [Zychaea mexicana]KAI9477698.1 hypothetical protein BDB00DRAFT_879404 [Zychaea mexicana]
MSAVVIAQQQQQQQPQQPPGTSSGGYRSLLSKPARLWQRSNKTAPLVDEKSPSVQPIDVPKNSSNSNKRNENKLTIVLRETAKGDIFKLSTINDSGFFLPPSPCEDSKRDHWLDIDQDELAFRLPSPDRLTTHSGDKEQRSFFTPSATF